MENNMIKIVEDQLDIRSKMFDRDYSKLKYYLRTSTFYSEPASTKYHNNFPTGLVRHCMNMFKCLEFKITNFYAKNAFSNDVFDPMLVSLAHDFNKIGRYVIKSKRFRKDDGQWIDVLSYDYQFDKQTVTSPELSIERILLLSDISKAEKLAIRWAEGAYGLEPSSMKLLSNAIAYDYRVELAHQADMDASHAIEKTGILNEEQQSEAIRKFQSGE